jgi:hypothetical protein
MDSDVFKKISLRGRVAYGIMCFEQMLIQFYDENKWSSILELLWSFVRTNNLELWGDKVNEIIPENLLEFDNYEESEFEYLSIEFYEYLVNLYQSLDDKINDFILKIYYLGTSHAYTNIENEGKTSLIVLQDIIDFMNKNNIIFPEYNNLICFSIDEDEGWGRKFNGKEYSLILQKSQ